MTEEKYTPIKHISPDGFLNKIIYYIRLFVDFQFNTVYFTLKKIVPFAKGNVLDVGCGNSPFKHMLDKSATNYYGLDIIESKEFNYSREDVHYFDGKDIPFDADFFDMVICTEVLEHTQDAKMLIEEMKRVLKENGKMVITVPWSARNHYIPHDYYRYTASTLSVLFSGFSESEIRTRGTDLTVIVSKIIVVFFRQFGKFQLKNLRLLFYFFLVLPFMIIFSPVLFLIIIFGHISVLFNIGSIDDCLGYSVIAKK